MEFQQTPSLAIGNSPKVESLVSNLHYTVPAFYHSPGIQGSRKLVKIRKNTGKLCLKGKMFIQRLQQVPGSFQWQEPAQKASGVEKELPCVKSSEGAWKISVSCGKMWEGF